MAQKRYAIVRVDDKCPAYEDYIFCGRIDKRFRIVDTTVDCNECKIRKNYGDTKEQLIRKVAQVLFKKFMKTNSRFKGLKKIQVAKRLAYKLAKEIVEFLGVEE